LSDRFLFPERLNRVSVTERRRAVDRGREQPEQRIRFTEKMREAVQPFRRRKLAALLELLSR